MGFYYVYNFISMNLNYFNIVFNYDDDQSRSVRFVFWFLSKYDCDGYLYFFFKRSYNTVPIESITCFIMSESENIRTKKSSFCS